VVGDVATAVRVDHDRLKGRGRNEEVLLERPYASGVGRRVLEEQDVVVTGLE
jgi:hypothetical protein